MKIATDKEVLDKWLSYKRPGEENILAFYEHRLGFVVKNPRLMLIPLDDHLVHRGDGVFETMKFKNRKLYLLKEHLERLKRSASSIYLDPPCAWERIGELILEVAATTREKDGIVSLFMGRGPGGFTTDFRECPESSLYIVVRRYPYKPESFWEKGVTAFRAETPAKQCYLARVKTVDYLPNVLMKREAILKGYDFPLCFDEKGFLAEGSTENVIMVSEQGEIVVPELSNALAGTTMMRALELLKAEHPIIFRPIREEELYAAREIILLGTTLDAVSVVRFNDKPVFDVRPGPLSKKIRQLLLADQESYGVPF
ncbi:MAG TPA: 4-amino-4-deoxychorismate lyase [Desulfonauticus sp.]|nr:MAG: Aminotransferase class IV [Desulfonauticus sp. 38_4375]MDK2921881.1 branched-chain amino acid aminotransferase [Desulfonauticus sp.]HCO11936.1 4-amino-4-deoxychorismate lyase [Desulfonauticus sp.]